MTATKGFQTCASAVVALLMSATLAQPAHAGEPTNEPTDDQATEQVRKELVATINKMQQTGYYITDVTPTQILIRKIEPGHSPICGPKGNVALAPDGTLNVKTLNDKAVKDTYLALSRMADDARSEPPVKTLIEIDPNPIRGACSTVPPRPVKKK